MHHDEFFDHAATQKVAKRALLSSLIAFLGGGAATVAPVPALVAIPFLVVAILVAISSVRTLVHPEAEVVGGIRWGGVVLAGIGALVAVLGIALRVLLIVRGG